ncbi:MAG: thiamine pyrophosphate-binding protein [Ferroplasma sp.]|uniref:thiamine pyrophosphate-binding protein n=1 Tax=Ferroplasma sp. TaxID=2591003 RepID=UPI002814E7CC|nr:thiamine pyrophosphate-binding protein [Ferroplasma sp.]WMT50691.1 MAG: thiamine pyrophosphate-binding protein [Ferroplasma sp.]
MIGYEIFNKTLKNMELYPVFGNPGTTEIPMLEDIESDNYILTLHDSISVGMADGRAQLTRKPSMVNLHSILGIGNSMAFIYSAYVHKIPMIITAGEQDNRHIFYDPLLSGNINDMISKYTKYSFEIRSANDIERAVRRAYISSITPPFSLSFLGFPMDTLEENAEFRNLTRPEVNSDIVDDRAVREICNEINNSGNPAMILGYEADLYGGIWHAKEFSRKLGIPVFAEPFASRGPYDSSDPYYAGDLPPVAERINKSLSAYDLIIMVGGDINLYPYSHSDLLSGRRIIKIGLDISGKIGDSYFMNPATFLRESLKYLHERKGEKIPVRPEVNKNSQIQRVMLKIHENFPGYTIADESISASPFLRQIVGYNQDSYFIGKSGQIGWALPAAAGMATVNPKVLCVIGDGAFMYTSQTLWTIRNYNLPVKLIILDNHGYGILRKFQEVNYENTGKYLTFSIELKKVVDSFGIDVRKNDENMRDIEWLRSHDGPAALIIRVDKPYGYNLFKK